MNIQVDARHVGNASIYDLETSWVHLNPFMSMISLQDKREAQKGGSNRWLIHQEAAALGH